MRVLRIISSLNPNFGGPPGSAMNSAVSVARAGMRSEVAVVVRPGETATPWWRELELRCSRENVALMVFPVSATRMSSPRYEPSTALASWLMRQARGHYDVIHAEGPWTGPSATAAALTIRNSSPLVITPNEVFTAFDMAKGQLGIRLAKRVGAYAYGRAGALIVCSSPLEMQDTRSSGLPAEKLAWVYPAVFDDRATAGPAEGVGGSRFGLRVGYLGRLDPKKNVDLLIEAVGRLGEGISLRVAGRGEPAFEDALHRRAGRLCPEQVDFVGWLAEPQKGAFFASIDVLVMPSKYECFGVAAIEALAAGVPLIVGNRVGAAGIVREGQAGVVVEPTTEAIVQALRRYRDDPQTRTEDARRARPAALADTSFSPHGERLVSLYSRVLSARTGSRPT